MNNICSSQEILNLFNELNKQNIKYVLLHNINDELPNNLSVNKDIDILVKDTCKSAFQSFMKVNAWKKIRHPYDIGNNFMFLYNMDKLEMYRKNRISLDICYQLNARSINNGEWMPLDQEINTSIWIGRKKNKIYPWYELDIENQVLHLVVRCIFYKKKFSCKYVESINHYFEKSSKEILEQKFSLVFFKFAPYLIELIELKKYGDIISEYFAFSNY